MPEPYGGMVLPGQVNGNWELIDGIGSRLSREVCSKGVRYPGFDKNVFICWHGFPIPVYRVVDKVDWSEIISEHEVFVNGNHGAAR